jgi:hypothetical protein
MIVYFGQFGENYRSCQNFGLFFPRIRLRIILTKMLWAIFSRTHLLALFRKHTWISIALQVFYSAGNLCNTQLAHCVVGRATFFQFQSMPSLKYIRKFDNLGISKSASVRRFERPTQGLACIAGKNASNATFKASWHICTHTQLNSRRSSI